MQQDKVEIESQRDLKKIVYWGGVCVGITHN